MEGSKNEGRVKMNNWLTEREAEDKRICIRDERKTGSTDKKRKCFGMEEEYDNGEMVWS